MPELMPQAMVSYGTGSDFRLYLVDETRNRDVLIQACTRFGTATSTATVAPKDGGGTIDPSIPHNCFVSLQPGTLKVDVVETTNDLYQLCVDSGACVSPDPDEAPKNTVCNIESEFGSCPVVSVPQGQAEKFCQYVGRRLPTSLEHILIRQANVPVVLTASAAGDVSKYPTGSTPPEKCSQAVLEGSGNCKKPRPVLTDGAPTGGAPEDKINVDDGGAIYDLMGNVAEWSADQAPSTRPNDSEDFGALPWFCAKPLENPGACDQTATCVYGQYVSQGTMGIWPVCVTSSKGTFLGTEGVLHGGSHDDADTSPRFIGVYGRRTVEEPDKLEVDARLAREFGFRCVGDREADDQGEVPDFDDRLIIQNWTGP